MAQCYLESIHHSADFSNNCQGTHKAVTCNTDIASGVMVSFVLEQGNIQCSFVLGLGLAHLD